MKKIKFRGIEIRVYPHKATRDIGKKQILKYKFRYDIRHAETAWDKPITIEKRVWVNFWGTIFTNKSLDKFFNDFSYILLTRKEIECFTS